MSYNGMTEDEARTKWCPMKRIAAPDCAAENWANPDRTGNLLPQSGSTDAEFRRTVPWMWKATRCIASDCMMWRKDYHSGPDVGHCGMAVMDPKQ